MLSEEIPVSIPLFRQYWLRTQDVLGEALGVRGNRHPFAGAQGLVLSLTSASCTLVWTYSVGVPLVAPPDTVSSDDCPRSDHMELSSSDSELYGAGAP